MTASDNDTAVDVDVEELDSAESWAEAVRSRQRLPRRWFRRLSTMNKRTTITTFVVLALLLGAVTTTTVVLGRSVTQHNATTAAAQSAQEAARSRISTVLSYNFNTIDTELPRVTDDLTGKFRSDFAEISSKVIIPIAHRDSIITTAKVVESSIVTADVDKVTVLLFLNQETSSAKYQGPRLDGSRIRVEMTKVDGQWLISDITPV
ncbi:hypothetical protein [Nocardia exalbida]|uniref:hypothetical protein n=1 Tax=Nocardia exalbida TaxID=290231 RepID=UPI0002FE0353|nr:hypothetical protein [Nocardia exalbida]